MRTIKKWITIGFGLGTGLFGSVLLAVTISLFSSGETLTAEKLNANFAELKAAVDNLTAQMATVMAYQAPAVVDANDTVVAVVTPRGMETANGYVLSDRAPMVIGVISLRISPVNDLNAGLYFTTTNCTGTAYTIAVDGTIFTYLLMSESSLLDPFYYTPKGDPIVDITYASRNSILGGNCSASSGTAKVRRALPNDPAVTGFDPANYVYPLRYR